MARKHGWQLPAHTLQIVAITVFFLLVVAFYAFFAPFLGKQVLEYVAIGIFTPVVFAVSILYIRCTSINPADPGIMSKFEGGFTDAPARTADLDGTNLGEKVDDATEAKSPTSTCRSSLNGRSENGRSNRGGLAVGDTDLSSQLPTRSSRSCLLGGIVCALFIKEDCRKFDDSENQVNGEDALFCTICNAEVHKYSKHCRSCDKCVDGFDHHCRWLNNCVGRKNYFTFIALMITSLLWLAIEFGMGIAVLVICFTNKNFETIIKDKLGSGLTRPPFAAIVAFFTLLSLVACIPLGELFFFHMILIRKGITTYEYVVAMRAMSEVPEEEDEEGVNIVYSPTNSATTAFSGASSLGIHHKGGWCTPPRIFVDQDEVIPHLEPGMVPSSVDPDAAGHAERANKAKKPVKISAWKLAKLDSNEAMKAAAKARASSSVLRPIDASRRGPYADLGSSGNGSMRSSMRSSMSIDYSTSKEKRIDKKLSSSQNSYPQSVASQDDYESGTPSASSISSPVNIQKPAPHTQINLPPRAPPQPPRPAPVVTQRPPVPAPTTQITRPVFQSATSYVRENRKASVVWDQEAGRYVSVAPTATRPGAIGVDLAARTPHFLANPGGEPSNRGTTAPSSSALPSGQPSERLTYTGQSIFFGGPLLGGATDPRRNEGGARMHQRETGGERRRTAESFPVFAPGIIQKNPPFNR